MQLDMNGPGKVHWYCGGRHGGACLLRALPASLHSLNDHGHGIPAA
jgi:hypothetical protein